MQFCAISLSTFHFWFCTVIRARNETRPSFGSLIFSKAQAVFYTHKHRVGNLRQKSQRPSRLVGRIVFQRCHHQNHISSRPGGGTGSWISPLIYLRALVPSRGSGVPPADPSGQDGGRRRRVSLPDAFSPPAPPRLGQGVGGELAGTPPAAGPLVSTAPTFTLPGAVLLDALLARAPRRSCNHRHPVSQVWCSPLLQASCPIPLMR